MRKVVSPLLLLLLASSLALAGAAHALPVPDLPDSLAAAPEFDSEDEAGGEGEWEEEEDEEAEWEEWGEGGEPPFECLLRSASAKAVVPGSQGKLRLTIRYTAFEPTAATVSAWLQGKGSVHLPLSPVRLGEAGTLHFSRPLTPVEAERARSARDFTVQLRIPTAPRECRPLFTRHLKPKRSGRGSQLWQQAGSIFGGDS